MALTADPTTTDRRYTLMPGDTLSALASQFDTTVGALVIANQLRTPDEVRTGLVLRIP